MQKFIYHRYGNLIGMVPGSLPTPLELTEFLRIVTLKKYGFQEVKVDIREVMFSVRGAKYRQSAGISNAPHEFNCSTYTRWVYGNLGVDLPIRSIDQASEGQRIGNYVPAGAFEVGDLLFTHGKGGFYYKNPDLQFGHVGIYAGEGEVVHAGSTPKTVHKENYFDFCNNPLHYRGAVRIVPLNGFVTLRIPDGLDDKVRTSLDVFWIIAKSLR